MAGTNCYMTSKTLIIILLASGLAGVVQAQSCGLDISFGGDGKVTTDFGWGGDAATSMAIQNDGKIVVAGRSKDDFNDYIFALARYNTNGTLDPTFGTNGELITDIGIDDEASAV